MGIFSKIKQGLAKTGAALGGAVNNIVTSFSGINEELYDELTEALILADTGVETAEKIVDELRTRVKEQRISDPAEIKDILKQVITDMLSVDNSLHLDTKPSLILMIGVNGVGKTTTIGKLSARLKSEGKSVILGAADTFRAAAAEQLTIWAERAGVPIVKQGEGSDPAAVVFDTIASAKARGTDVIICDTAGRLHNKKNLMDELGKIARIIRRELPDASVETLLVLDATTGQNALNQAKEFRQVADISGIVLTKLDGTARGGVVLGITDKLGIPVKLIGVGEQIDDLQDFSAEDFAAALFD